MIPAERDGKKRTRNTMPSWKHWSADCPYMPSSWTLPQQVLSPASAAIKPIVRFRRKMRCWTASGGCRMPLKEGKLRISPACRDTIREFGLYRWDIRAAKDAPRKEHDHAMDDIRYFVTTILCREEEGFYALATERR